MTGLVGEKVLKQRKCVVLRHRRKNGCGVGDGPFRNVDSQVCPPVCVREFGREGSLRLKFRLVPQRHVRGETAVGRDGGPPARGIEKRGRERIRKRDGEFFARQGLELLKDIPFVEDGVGFRVRKWAEVPADDIGTVDACKERSLPCSTLREPVDPKCGVEGPDDVVRSAVFGKGGMPRLVMGKPPEGGAFRFCKGIRVRRRADAESVQKEEENVLHPNRITSTGEK